MAMNIDLKNLNMSDIQDQIKKLMANKKLVTKIGIIFGAIVFFLIIYYAVLNPMVNSRKAKLDDMNKKKQETEQFTKDINSMKAKIKKLKYSSEYLIISGFTFAIVSIQEAWDKMNIPNKTIGIDSHIACLTKGPISAIFFAPNSWATMGVTKNNIPPIPTIIGNHKFPANIIPACTSVE